MPFFSEEKDWRVTRPSPLPFSQTLRSKFLDSRLLSIGERPNNLDDIMTPTAPGVRALYVIKVARYLSIVFVIGKYAHIFGGSTNF